MFLTVVTAPISAKSVSGWLPVVRLTGGLAEHPYIRNHGSETSANMFEVEKPPAVSYI
jgi:hypothetical protein